MIINILVITLKKYLAVTPHGAGSDDWKDILGPLKKNVKNGEQMKKKNVKNKLFGEKKNVKYKFSKMRMPGTLPTENIFWKFKSEIC